MVKVKVEAFEYVTTTVVNLPEGKEVSYDQSSLPPTTAVNRVYDQYPDCTSVLLTVIRKKLN